MKSSTKSILVAGALLMALLGSVALYFGGKIIRFAQADAQRRAHAIQVANSLSPGRFERLVSDSRALAQGAKFSKPPYLNSAWMWDEKSGYPAEFEDIKPLRIYVENDEVWFLTYKSMDIEVGIVVIRPLSGAPEVALRTGLDEKYRRTDTILYRK